MFDSLTAKFKKKKVSKKPIFVNHREHLFETWSKILFTYIILNVIFVLVSVLMIFTLSNSQREASEEVSGSSSLTNSEITAANQQLRYKTILRSGLINLPSLPEM